MVVVVMVAADVVVVPTLISGIIFTTINILFKLDMYILDESSIHVNRIVR
jgi:hypothetical protein